MNLSRIGQFCCRELNSSVPRLSSSSLSLLASSPECKRNSTLSNPNKRNSSSDSSMPKVRLPPPRTFSGIQPTGVLHLGNYLGAVKGWVKGLEVAEEKRDSQIFCVVDMHAITLPQNPQVLRANVRTMTASLLACGLSPSKCILFQQSTVAEHAELCWILACLASVPRFCHLSARIGALFHTQAAPLSSHLFLRLVSLQAGHPDTVQGKGSKTARGPSWPLHIPRPSGCRYTVVQSNQSACW